jgi:F-type H+-transporting ATPase subunit delta
MRYGAKEYARALYEELRKQSENAAKKTIKRFVADLMERRLAALLPEIIKELPAAIKKTDDIEDVIIESAHELDQTTQNAILQILDKNSERIEVTVIRNPKLIGGIRIRGRDTLFDATVKGKLQKLRTILVK